jgi:hypothetical protein
MTYVSELRNLVGHRPLLLAAAGVVVVDDLGRWLLQWRVDDGLWGLIGGALELGESSGWAGRSTTDARPSATPSSSGNRRRIERAHTPAGPAHVGASLRPPPRLSEGGADRVRGVAVEVEVGRGRSGG